MAFQIDRKMAINRKRKWNVANGHGYHVKDAAKDAEIADLKLMLREVKQAGLIYWEPNTDRGHVAKAMMLKRIDVALNPERAK